MIRTIFPRSVAVLCLAAVSTGAVHAAEKALDKGRAAAGQAVSFNVYLPLQNRAALESQIANLNDSSSAQYHHWLTPEEFAAKYAPTAAQVAAVQQQLAAQGLTVTAV